MRTARHTFALATLLAVLGGATLQARPDHHRPPKPRHEDLHTTLHVVNTVANVINALKPVTVVQPPAPVAPAPVVQQPTVVQPTVVQPAPLVQEVVVQQPTVVQPTVVQPTVVQPTVVVPQPTVVQPVVVEPRPYYRPAPPPYHHRPAPPPHHRPQHWR